MGLRDEEGRARYLRLIENNNKVLFLKEEGISTKSFLLSVMCLAFFTYKIFPAE